MSDTNVFHQRTVTRLLKDHDLTMWELSFLESIEKRINQGRELSEKQAATLNKVAHRVDFGD